MKPAPSRLLALSILACMALAVAMLTHRAFAAYSRQVIAIEQRQRDYARLASLADESDAVAAWADGLDRTHSGELLLKGDDVSLMAAELQSKLGQYAVDGGTAISSFRSLEPGSDDELTTIGVAIQLRGELASLLRFVGQVQSAAPPLFISKATLKVDQYGSMPGAGEAMIDAELQVHGYAEPPPAKTPKR